MGQLNTQAAVYSWKLLLGQVTQNRVNVSKKITLNALSQHPITVIKGQVMASSLILSLPLSLSLTHTRIIKEQFMASFLTHSLTHSHIHSGLV